jgi:hypothetical protein
LHGPAKLTRKIKGQIDGIGTRPRLRASGAKGTSLIDREYDAATIPNVPAALQSACPWRIRKSPHKRIGQGSLVRYRAPPCHGAHPTRTLAAKFAVMHNAAFPGRV